MKNQKSGNGEVFLQLVTLLVPRQPETHRDFHRVPKRGHCSDKAEIVADTFNKKMEPGSRMSKFKQPLI